MELRDNDVVLRAWRESDAAAVAAACSDPDIARWLPLVPVPYTLADAEAYIRGCLDADAQRKPFAVADAHSDELIGSIDMNVNRWHVGHIGYWVAPRARGRGVCTTALSLLSSWGLGDLGLGRLELMTDPENVASQRVAEKAGYRREAVLRSFLEYRDGTRADAVVFALLPGELTG